MNIRHFTVKVLNLLAAEQRLDFDDLRAQLGYSRRDFRLAINEFLRRNRHGAYLLSLIDPEADNEFDPRTAFARKDGGPTTMTDDNKPGTDELGANQLSRSLELLYNEVDEVELCMERYPQYLPDAWRRLTDSLNLLDELVDKISGDLNDHFALARVLIPLFCQHRIIKVTDDLIDPSGFNLEEVPDRAYSLFRPQFSKEQDQLERVLSPEFPAIHHHMLCVRNVIRDVLGKEYLFIRAYRVGHTLDLDLVLVVVEAQVKGGCYQIDDDGHIGGEGKGRWYGVLCPAEAQAQLVADLKAEEARRRKSLPEVVFGLPEDSNDDDD
jgi:hypothetical protein